MSTYLGTRGEAGWTRCSRSGCQRSHSEHHESADAMLCPVTPETLTDEMVRALLDTVQGARAAGDDDMAAVCDRALSIAIDDDDDSISERMHGRLRTLTGQQAQQLCADAITAARAQEVK